jgi:hypothetical protein
VDGEATATVITGFFRVGFGNRHDVRMPRLRSSRIRESENRGFGEKGRWRLCGTI